jgi:hypothetical protein
MPQAASTSGLATSAVSTELPSFWRMVALLEAQKLIRAPMGKIASF